MKDILSMWNGYAFDGIHQLRKLVFDNYQACPVPLKAEETIGSYSK